MRNWAVIDLDAIRRNYQAIRSCAGGRQVLAVVKADAYGHGAAHVARFLQKLGCERVAVATVEEALSLRDAGLRIPIHMLACVPPSDYYRAIGEDFVFTIGSIDEARSLADVASRAGSRETVHIEIDTGMGRSGCRPGDARAMVEEVVSHEELLLEGAMTHFPSADDLADPHGLQFAREQVAAFLSVEPILREAGVDRPVLHAANSAGVACIPESHLTLIRPGGALYGLTAGPRTPSRIDLTPALTWKATIVQIREFNPGTTVGYGRAFAVTQRMRIATIAAGYGDGFARAYGPTGRVLVHGRRVPVVGRVSMDSTCIDLTDIPEARTGDEVCLIGAQGNERISAEDLAAIGTTSPYEATCRISGRVPRIYVGG